MAYNKVIYKGETLIDLTDVDITEADVAKGKKFIKSNGVKSIGTSTGGGSEVVLGELTATANGTYECGNETDIDLVPGGLYEYKKVLPANVLKELFEKTTSDNRILFGNLQLVATGIEKINDVYALELIIFGGELLFIYATADTTINLGDLNLSVNTGWNSYFHGDSGATPSDPPLIRLPHDLTNVPVSFSNLFGKQFDTNNEITMSSINTSETVTISNMGQFNKVDSFPTNITKQNIALLSLMGHDEFDEIAEGSAEAIQNLIIFRYFAPSKLQTDIDGLKHLSLMGGPILVYVDDSSKVQTTVGTVETGCWYVSYDISGSLLNSTWAQEKDPIDGYSKVTVNVEPNLQNIAVTTNGVYTCNEGFDGLGQVTVDIIKNLQNKTVTENGIYTCDEGFDGLGQVTVNFQSRNSFNDGKLSVHTVIGEDDLNLDANKNTVEELIVNEGVTSIITTNLVSSTCPNLAKVFLPITLQTIGSKVFYSCKNLSSINIPEHVTSIGSNAFRDCSSLKEVVLPEGISKIEYSTFMNCFYLSIINLPNSITSIESRAFESCRELKEAILPNSLTIIENSTFSGCSKLEKVSLPNTVTSIGERAFSGCAFKEFNIPDGVSSIGESAFYGCGYLTGIMIPSGVTRINNNTFFGCRSLSDITIPNGVTSIGYSAFMNCSSLTSITIPDSVTSIGERAFYYCERLTSITFNGTQDQWNSISKGKDWDSNTGAYTIHCTDGDIAK